MRKILWLIIFICGYLWLSTPGQKEIALEKGRAAYKALVTWFDEAEIDLHFKKEKAKKRSRRWD